jgi:hypothetical protein
MNTEGGGERGPGRRAGDNSLATPRKLSTKSFSQGPSGFQNSARVKILPTMCSLHLCQKLSIRLLPSFDLPSRLDGSSSPPHCEAPSLAPK